MTDLNLAELKTNRRQLRINSGAVGRLFKETTLYRDEVKGLETKKSELVAPGMDLEAWDIKNTSRMIDESNRLVEDTKKRLKTAVDSLENVVAGAKESGMSQDEELVKAEELLQKIKDDDVGAKAKSGEIKQDEELVKAEEILQKIKGDDVGAKAKSGEINQDLDDEESLKAAKVLQKKQ